MSASSQLPPELQPTVVPGLGVPLYRDNPNVACFKSFGSDWEETHPVLGQVEGSIAPGLGGTDLFVTVNHPDGGSWHYKIDGNDVVAAVLADVAARRAAGARPPRVGEDADGVAFSEEFVAGRKAAAEASVAESTARRDARQAAMDSAEASFRAKHGDTLEEIEAQDVRIKLALVPVDEVRGDFGAYFEERYGHLVTARGTPRSAGYSPDWHFWDPETLPNFPSFEGHHVVLLASPLTRDAHWMLVNRRTALLRGHVEAIQSEIEAVEESVPRATPTFAALTMGDVRLEAALSALSRPPMTYFAPTGAQPRMAWISPDGRIWCCDKMEHGDLAEVLFHEFHDGEPEDDFGAPNYRRTLENLGWWHHGTYDMGAGKAYVHGAESASKAPAAVVRATLDLAEAYADSDEPWRGDELRAEARRLEAGDEFEIPNNLGLNTPKWMRSGD